MTLCEKAKPARFRGWLRSSWQGSSCVEPSDDALDDPSAREGLDALYGVGAADNLERPTPEFGQYPSELATGIGGVGEDETQPRECVAQGGE